MQKQLTTPKLPPKEKRFNIFNGKYRILESLGKGKTSKVYLVEDIHEPGRKYALKLIKHEYLLSDKQHIHNIEREIEVINSLCHESIIRLHEYGSKGKLVH